ncbi:transposase (plasmid) [Streptomyces sp. QH1-20]|uniref:transposase n=1 Tax=Streptomyces sp. QH1-20 TaxID=3240934 RepID=UPI0035132F03
MRPALGHRPAGTLVGTGRADPGLEGQRPPAPREHHARDRLPRRALVHRVHRQVPRRCSPPSSTGSPARPGTVHVISDRHPVHRSKAVHAWLEKNPERIELHLMPGRSPELNPHEILNADIEPNAHAARAHAANDLACETHRFLHRRQRQPRHVRGYFHAHHVRYTLE